jgi:hypothetical protein
VTGVIQLILYRKRAPAPATSANTERPPARTAPRDSVPAPRVEKAALLEVEAEAPPEAAEPDEDDLALVALAAEPDEPEGLPEALAPPDAAADDPDAAPVVTTLARARDAMPLPTEV